MVGFDSVPEYIYQLVYMETEFKNHQIAVDFLGLIYPKEGIRDSDCISDFKLNLNDGFGRGW